jgi:hypothetical protein
MVGSFADFHGLGTPVTPPGSYDTMYEVQYTVSAEDSQDWSPCAETTTVKGGVVSSGCNKASARMRTDYQLAPRVRVPQSV